MMDMDSDYCCSTDWEMESFVESLLVSDELVSPTYADHLQEIDAPGNFLSSMGGIELGYDLWCSEEEKSKFVDSLGLGSISSSSEDWYLNLPPKASSLMQNDQGCDAQYQMLDKEGDCGDSPSIEICSDQGNESSSIYCSYQEEGDDIDVTVENVEEVEDSWSTVEEQMLRAAMADNILMQPIIQWKRIAEALPWRTPLEVFNRTNQLLQTVLRDLAIFTTEQQQQCHQQEQVGVIIVSPPEQEEQIRKVQKRRWSEEEHEKFLVGVERYGWGNWKKVATLIPSRTVPQITSHAQKCQKQNNPNNIIPKKRRTRKNLQLISC